MTRNDWLRLSSAIGGLALIIAGSTLAILAAVNWESLEQPQRIFVIALGSAGVVVGPALLVLSRPSGATLKALRRLFVLLIGSTVILLGLAMILLPGPGWVTIFAGLGILATEFAFARKVLLKARDTAEFAARKVGISDRTARKMGLHKMMRQADKHAPPSSQ